MGLPPRLAGVTLLALGNGASDLSSSIAAVRTGETRLALGALTGAGMFVGFVVGGRIVTISGGVKARGAQIRDILFQSLAVAAVFVMILGGSVGYGGVGFLLSLYAAYVLIVAIADFTKKAGVEWHEIGRDLSRVMTGGRFELLLPAGGGEGGDQLSDVSSETDLEAESLLDDQQLLQHDVHPPQATLTNTKVLLHDRDTRVAAAVEKGSSGAARNKSGTGSHSSQVELTETQQHLHSPSAAGGGGVEEEGTVKKAGPFQSPQQQQPSPLDHHRQQQQSDQSPVALFQPRINYDDMVHMSAAEYRQRALADMAQAKSFYRRRGGGREEESEEEDYGASGASTRRKSTYTAPDISILEQGEGGGGEGVQKEQQHVPPPSSSPAAAVVVLTDQAGLILPGDGGGTDKYDDGYAYIKQLPLFQHLYRVLLIVEMPLMNMLRGTIPMVEVNSYRRRWFILAMTLSPLVITFHLGAYKDVLGVLVCIIAGGVLGGIAAWSTAGLEDEEAPLGRLGTPFPIGAAVVAVYGFGVAALWIDSFASEIVGILKLFGIAAGVDSAVLGLTVLAWGNSLMDFMNNTTLAEKSAGGNSMAMTACFAGPLFNLLCGLGLGFWSALRDGGDGVVRVAVYVDPVVVVGCLFIVAGCIGLSVAAFQHSHWLSEKVGRMMVGWYGLYMVIVLLIAVFV